MRRSPLPREYTLKSLLPAFALLIAASSAFASDDFDTCKTTLAARASEAGLASDLIERVLNSLQHAPRVIELDRRQPEFTDTLANYLSRRITPDRIAEGRKLLQTQRRVLQQATERFGVQPQYLIAFWGLETNYGRNLGNMSVLDSLGTLACDTRRPELFTGEFLEAMRLLARGHVEPRQMIGSWAGAMGHTQFMPSTYMRYGIDGDGDGRIDLWRSVPDALLSAGNYLQHIGWQRGVRWGREVTLPKDFDYSLAGRDGFRPLEEWRKAGVLDAQGRALPVADFEAALLVPSGHRGPAFLIYDNFRAIMRWNRSEYYALSVALLADAIAGAPGLVKQPPKDLPRLSREQIVALQVALSERGHDVGEHDGVLGSATRRAVQALQKDLGLIADGQVDQGLLTRLDIR
jgi:membrane-bound lytic murein transglycosylase B